MPEESAFKTYAPIVGYIVAFVVMLIYNMALDEIFTLSAVYFLTFGIGVVLTKIYKGEIDIDLEEVKDMELKNLDTYEMDGIIKVFKQRGYEPEVALESFEEIETEGVKELTPKFVVKIEEKKEE